MILHKNLYLCKIFYNHNMHLGGFVKICLTKNKICFAVCNKTKSQVVKIKIDFKFDVKSWWFYDKKF